MVIVSFLRLKTLSIFLPPHPLAMFGNLVHLFGSTRENEHRALDMLDRHSTIELL